MSYPIRTAAVVFLLCEMGATLGGAPVPRSVSISRQFIVYGADARLRGAICDVAERTKEAALRVLHEGDEWKTPIVVSVQLPQANLPELPGAQLNVSQTGFGLKLQLDLTVGADVSAPAVERELLRAVFIEMIYRNAPNLAPGTRYVEPPAWLLDGTLALAPGHDSAAIADALGTAVASGNVLPLPEFLRQQPALLDSPSRELYRAYAKALVLVLIEMPEGERRLARFLSDLQHASNDPMVELQAHFPSLGSNADEMQKQWSVAVSRLAAREHYRLLSCEESERELAKLLHVELREANDPAVTYALEEFPSFVRTARAAAALKALRQELLVLSGRANPLYRPVIAEYEKLAAQLARKKTKKVTERLAELRATREHITRRMGAIADYLNWFEATQSRAASGAFRAYMKAAELAADREYRRRDAISVYLDSIETQFQ
jgi:hypothetical protein